MHLIPASHARATAQALLQAAGLGEGMARPVADKLIESDLLGHRTHGLAMLPVYLERLGDGRIATQGAIDTLNDDGGASFAWQANRLPGAWVMGRAFDEALRRAERHAVVTATVGNCTHIGALQAYLEDVGRRGLLALMMVTDPGVASVAPFGGVDPVLTSNPIAACFPTDGDPVLIDFSTSLSSNAAIAQRGAAGQRLPGAWLLDAQGRPSDDPAALNTTPPGTLMPLGGSEFGYKGFALGLMVEAFALALSGYARNQPRLRGAQGVFLQLIDPAHFAGRESFVAAASFLVGQCRASRPAEGSSGVRLPGESALQHKARQLAHGLEVQGAVLDRLASWAQRLNVAPLV